MRLISLPKERTSHHPARPAVDWRSLAGWLGAFAFSLAAWAGVIALISHVSE